VCCHALPSLAQPSYSVLTTRATSRAATKDEPGQGNRPADPGRVLMTVLRTGCCCRKPVQLRRLQRRRATVALAFFHAAARCEQAQPPHARRQPAIH
jgi:hypothetical protein